LTGVNGASGANTTDTNMVLVAHGTQDTAVAGNALVLKRTAMAFCFLVAFVKHVCRVCFTPVPGSRKQFVNVHAIVVGTIGTRRTCFAFFLYVLIIIESFAQASGRLSVARRVARGTIGTARRTIGIGGFAGVGQIRIDTTFFARRFTFAVLVLAGWAIGTITLGTAEFS